MEQQKTGVWIEWNGGTCPVPNGTRIMVTFRSSPNYPLDETTPEIMDWKHRDSIGDIIAYLVIPRFVPKPKPERWAIVKRTQPIGHGCVIDYLTHYAINDRTSMKLGNLVATTDGEYALLQRFVKLLNEVAP